MLVVSAHLRNEANIILNDLLFSFLVLDITYQGTQMKCATLHFVSSQTNRLDHFCLNSGIALLAYKHYVVFRRRTTIKILAAYSFMGICAPRKHRFYVPSFSFVIDNRYRTNLKSVNNLENVQKRRDRLYIIAQILEIAKSGCLKTQIMYRANLSFAQLNEYLSFLTRIHLLKLENENNKNTYITSAKGNQYLEKYEDVADLLEDDEDQ